MSDNRRKFFRNLLGIIPATVIGEELTKTSPPPTKDELLEKLSQRLTEAEKNLAQQKEQQELSKYFTPYPCSSVYIPNEVKEKLFSKKL